MNNGWAIVLKIQHSNTATRHLYKLKRHKCAPIGFQQSLPTNLFLINQEQYYNNNHHRPHWGGQHAIVAKGLRTHYCLVFHTIEFAVELALMYSYMTEYVTVHRSRHRR